jgi:hypothetical protein
MAYTRGTSANIIVGAAALFTYDGPIGLDSNGRITDDQAETDLLAFEASKSYKDTLTDTSGSGFQNVGYTSNGLELMFQPDFGEVKVDQVLDVAKLFKQGMQVNLKTSFAEATLENLLLAIAQKDSDLTDKMETIAPATTGVSVGSEVELKSGELGEYPLERQIIAIGASTEAGMLSDSGTAAQRVYIAYRALSIESVTVSAKRDEATMFEVNFRLLPDNDGVYGKIIDRTYTPVA